MKKAGVAYEELVASVARTFEPAAEVRQGEWVAGPDGHRDMDVVIEGEIDGHPRRIVIECKDYDPEKTGKVGIGEVDRLESKRRDIAADFAFLCSNSGFTQAAIRKGGRTGVGLISVLKKGDDRVKVKIQEETYFFDAEIENIQVTYTFAGPQKKSPILEGARYKGLPVVNWLSDRIVNILYANPRVLSGPIRDELPFKERLPFQLGDGSIGIVRGLAVRFDFTRQWFARVVELDATVAIYDYVRRRLRLPPSSRTSVDMKNVAIDNNKKLVGEPIDFPPPDWLSGFQPGEFAMRLSSIRGMPSRRDGGVPPLEEHISAKDLDLSIGGSDPPPGGG